MVPFSAAVRSVRINISVFQPLFSSRTFTKSAFALYKKVPKPEKFYFSPLVSETYTLTAAHCFNIPRVIDNLKIIVGEHDTSKGTDTPYATIYAIRQIIKHESYVPTSSHQNFDIALARHDEVMWKLTIGPACLPFPSVMSSNATYFDGKALTGKLNF